MTTEPVTQREPDQSLDWMRQISKQGLAKDSEVGVLRNIWKRAKTGGENTDAMNDVMRQLKRHSSHEEVIQYYRDCMYYLQCRRVQIDAESLFSNLTVSPSASSVAADDLWTAQEKGYLAGRINQPVEECPYPSGSEFAQAWSQWRKRGIETTTREGGPNTRQASAAKQHPTRGAAPISRPAAKKKGTSKKTPGKKTANNGIEVTPTPESRLRKPDAGAAVH